MDKCSEGKGEGYSITACNHLDINDETGIDNNKAKYCCLIHYTWKDNYSKNEKIKECLPLSENDYNDIKQYKNKLQKRLEEKHNNNGYENKINDLKIKCYSNNISLGIYSIIYLFILIL